MLLPRPGPPPVAGARLSHHESIPITWGAQQWWEPIPVGLPDAATGSDQSLKSGLRTTGADDRTARGRVDPRPPVGLRVQARTATRVSARP